MLQALSAIYWLLNLISLLTDNADGRCLFSSAVTKCHLRDNGNDAILHYNYPFLHNGFGLRLFLPCENTLCRKPFILSNFTQIWILIAFCSNIAADFETWVELNMGQSLPERHKQPESIGLAILFVASLLYLWISVTPFEDLASAPVPRAAINQLIGAAVTAMLLFAAVKLKILPLILRPRTIIFLTFGWLAICSVMAVAPVTALQRLLFTFLITVMVSVLLMLPRDKHQFSRYLACFSIVVLALCYFGVIFLKARAVHQSFDLAEPQLAGDWRGIFNHKNSTAPAMIMIALFGLFLRQTWSKLGGAVITLLAVFFLYKTNGKTAAMLLPATLILMWLIERAPRLTPVIALSVLGALGVIVVGSSFSPEIRSFVDGLGIDSTFTGRTDIWQLSMETVPLSPIFGQGFQSFWNSAALLSQEGFTDTWAIGASHAHNGYIEALLNGGIPALILVVVWLVILPACDYARAQRSGADTDLNRLFGRIWVYAILAACLESSFFTGNGAAWSCMLLAVFGLHLQARAVLR
jgi:O-antigen ligase